MLHSEDKYKKSAKTRVSGTRLVSTAMETWETRGQTGSIRIILPETVAEFEYRSSDVGETFRLSSVFAGFSRFTFPQTITPRGHLQIRSSFW